MDAGEMDYSYGAGYCRHGRGKDPSLRSDGRRNERKQESGQPECPAGKITHTKIETHPCPALMERQVHKIHATPEYQKGQKDHPNHPKIFAVDLRFMIA